MDKLRKYKEALEFIASQTDKAGNWAVEIAKQALSDNTHEPKIKEHTLTLTPEEQLQTGLGWPTKKWGCY